MARTCPRVAAEILIFHCCCGTQRSEGSCSGFAVVLGGNLGQNSGKIPGNFRQTIVFSYEFAGCPANFNAPGLVVKKGSDTLSEDVGLVRQNNIITGLHGYPLRPNGRRNDSLAHGHRFENLKPRAAADTKRYHAYGSAREEGTDVLNPSCDFDVFLPGGQRLKIGGGLSAYDAQ